MRITTYITFFRVSVWALKQDIYTETMPQLNELYFTATRLLTHAITVIQFPDAP
jgi:hypothetical protein